MPWNIMEGLKKVLTNFKCRCWVRRRELSASSSNCLYSSIRVDEEVGWSLESVLTTVMYLKIFRPLWKEDCSPMPLTFLRHRVKEIYRFINSTSLSSKCWWPKMQLFS